MKRCTQQEFYDFIDSYPKPLDADVCGIGEPPVLTLHDFSDGKKWPESVVARCKVFPNKRYYTDVFKGSKPSRKGRGREAEWEIKKTP
jgi:hypothetical protein